MDTQCERPAAFSLQSIFNQVLKPLDVKTKFYNAEVSAGPIGPWLNELFLSVLAALRLIPPLIFIIGACWLPVEADRDGGERVFSSQPSF